MYNDSFYVVSGNFTGELVNSYVSEAVECQFWLVCLISVLGGVDKLAFCRTVVFVIEVAVLVKHLSD